MNNSSNSADPPCRLPKLWIDSLPLDICVRIASIVKISDYVSAVNLLAVSSTQCTAVKHAMSYRIGLDKSYRNGAFTNESFEYMRTVGKSNIDRGFKLVNDPREIQTPCYLLYYPCLRPYFSIPSLTKLIIDDFQDVHVPELTLPLPVNNLRKLELRLNYNGGFTHLLKHISCLGLRELMLVTMRGICLHKNLPEWPEDPAFLARCFPNVEKLHLECDPCLRRNAEPPALLWRAIERFSKLTHVTLTETVPDDAVEKLRHLQSITVMGGSLFELIRKIPDRITGIVTSRSWSEAVPTRFTLDEGHFELLARCTRLESLECCIKPGAERLLASAVKNLRSLGLALECDAESHYGGREVMEPINGAVLTAVRQAPFLKSIRLVNMRICREELREVLVVCGKQMEAFREEVIGRCSSYAFLATALLFTPGTDRCKYEVGEFISTLRTAALHNTSLRHFEIPMPNISFLDDDSLSTQTCELKRALELLERRAPQLDMKELMKQSQMGFGPLLHC